MNNWIAEALDMIPRPLMLLTVVSVRGSAPRETGVKMLVGSDFVGGTIGGGQLEYRAINLARQTLSESEKPNADYVRRFPLGPEIGQCCGGVVTVLFESLSAESKNWLDALNHFEEIGQPAVTITSINADGLCEKQTVTANQSTGYGIDSPIDDEAIKIAREMLATGSAPVWSTGDALNSPAHYFEPLSSNNMQIVLFGAGHVGRAVVSAFASQACTIQWVDSRVDQFPESIPANVRTTVANDPTIEVHRAAPNSYFLVMTHSHPQDQELTEHILRRGDFRYFGLIGSISKRRNFEKRLCCKGVSSNTLSRMTCPIGVEGISNKSPESIAISVAAQLLQIREQTKQLVKSPKLRKVEATL